MQYSTIYFQEGDWQNIAEQIFNFKEPIGH